MAYYLSYVIFTEKTKQLGHASLCVTECHPGETPRILFRVGLLRPS